MALPPDAVLLVVSVAPPERTPVSGSIEAFGVAAWAASMIVTPSSPKTTVNIVNRTCLGMRVTNLRSLWIVRDFFISYHE